MTEDRPASSAGPHFEIEGDRLRTERLVLRPWGRDDAEAALEIYGTDEVTRWLSPAMGRVDEVDAMADILAEWATPLEFPQRRWALELASDGTLVGGAGLIPLPPDGVDLEVSWQLAPAWWGQGLAGEAGHGIAHYAFDSGVDEMFAVVRPHNTRGAATARSIGMEWVGETEKYYQLSLQVYRLRPGDLDVPQTPEGLSKRPV